MNDWLAEESIKASYREVWRQYRRDDELEVTTENHRRLHAMLREITASFGRPISVLEAGCGTGRYFHCLENVEELVGVDVSPEMLDAAQQPVRSELITVKNIKLQCRNIHHDAFRPETFDFIYSLGMFGNGCPVTADICDRFYDWLKPDGKLFFNTIQQTGSRFYVQGRKKFRQWVYTLLPRRMQQAMDERQQRFPFYALTKKELEAILRVTHFKSFVVSEQVSHSPLATGPRLECLACKTEINVPPPAPKPIPTVQQGVTV
jgi:cyclopropane fatty-acyl-phospholipid synthase-like methyltransferase